MKKKLSMSLAAVAFAVVVATTSSTTASEVTERVVQAAFEGVRQDLSNAVINRGYKIDYRAFIGDMLTRTSADVGGKKKIYKNAESIQFCSAVLSRKAMEADPANIAFCPYVLFVYQSADEPKKVRVGFRRLDERGNEASKAALKRINSLLDEIILEAIDQ